jgi:hypothetical protein
MVQAVSAGAVAAVTEWTIDPGASYGGETFCSVNGTAPGEGGADPHDERHFPSQTSALNFLFGHKMKIGDVLTVAGDGGRALDVDMVRRGERICYDVGTHEISTPEELIRYLDGLLQPGDSVRYLRN